VLAPGQFTWIETTSRPKSGKNWVFSFDSE